MFFLRGTSAPAICCAQNHLPLSSTQRSSQRATSLPITEGERYYSYSSSPPLYYDDRGYSPPEYFRHPLSTSPSPSPSPPSSPSTGSGKYVYPDPEVCSRDNPAGPYFSKGGSDPNAAVLDYATSACPARAHERTFFCNESCDNTPGAPVWSAPFEEGTSSLERTEEEEECQRHWGGDTLLPSIEEDSASKPEEEDDATAEVEPSLEEAGAMERNSAPTGETPKACVLRQMSPRQRMQFFAKRALNRKAKKVEERLASKKNPDDLYNLRLKKRAKAVKKVMEERLRDPGWSRSRVLKRSRLVKELVVKGRRMGVRYHEGKGLITVAEFDVECVCGCGAEEGKTCKRF